MARGAIGIIRTTNIRRAFGDAIRRADIYYELEELAVEMIAVAQGILSEETGEGIWPYERPKGRESVINMFHMAITESRMGQSWTVTIYNNSRHALLLELGTQEHFIFPRTVGGFEGEGAGTDEGDEESGDTKLRFIGYKGTKVALDYTHVSGVEAIHYMERAMEMVLTSANVAHKISESITRAYNGKR